jgi:hypothetical protein
VPPRKMLLDEVDEDYLDYEDEEDEEDEEEEDREEEEEEEGGWEVRRGGWISIGRGDWI